MPSLTIPFFNKLDTINPPHMIENSTVQDINNLDWTIPAGEGPNLGIMTMRNSMLNNSIYTATDVDFIRGLADASIIMTSAPSPASQSWILWGRSKLIANTALCQINTATGVRSLYVMQDLGGGATSPPYVAKIVNALTPRYLVPGTMNFGSLSTKINGPLIVEPFQIAGTGVSVSGSPGVVTGYTGWYGLAFVGGFINFNGVTTGGDDGHGNYAIAAVTNTQLTLYSAPPTYTNVPFNVTKGQHIQWGGASILPVANAVFKTRVWVGQNDKLYFTDPLVPYNTSGLYIDNGANSYFSFTDNNGGPILNIIPYQGRLIIFQANAISQIIPTPVITSSIQQLIHESEGIMAADCACWTPYGIVFGDSYGDVRITDGNSVNSIVLSSRINNKIIIDLNTKFLYSNNKVYIFSGITRNMLSLTGYYSKVSIYDFVSDNWTFYTGENVEDAAYNYAYSFYFPSLTNKGLPQFLFADTLNPGSIYEGNTKNATILSCSFKVKDLFLDDDPNTEKTMAEVTLDLFSSQNNVIITCTPYYDGVAGATQTYTTGNYATQTGIWRFDQQSKFRRVSLLFSFTANSNSGMAILGNLKINYEVMTDKPKGGAPLISGEVLAH